jgi:hypothetical protein
MSPASTLAGILGVAVASGVNLYLTVLAVGLAQRFHWVSGLPPELGVLGHPLVLIAAGLLFLIEFFADKIPFVTVLWDGLHTFVRPVGGALLALGVAEKLPPAVQVLALLAGGTIALGTHGGKMGFRLLAHTAPEPGTHSLISVAEDLGVLGLLALAYSHPWVAIPILVAIILAAAIMLPLVVRILRFLLTALVGRCHAWFGHRDGSRPPRWASLALLELDPAGQPALLRAFARKVKGAPRLKAGFLARPGGRWTFLHQGWFRTRTLALEDEGATVARVDRGLVCDALILVHGGRSQIFLVPKDWGGVLDGMGIQPLGSKMGGSPDPTGRDQ